VVGLDSGHSDCDPECRTLAARVRHSQGRVPLMDVPLPRKARIMTDPSKEVRSTYLLVTGVNSWGCQHWFAVCSGVPHAAHRPAVKVLRLGSYTRACVYMKFPAVLLNRGLPGRPPFASEHRSDCLLIRCIHFAVDVMLTNTEVCTWSYD